MDSKVTHDDFLNPTSMLTPGLAGSLTMLITNALSVHFNLLPNWTALVLSFLFGLLVFASTRTVLWLRSVLYLLNSLFIFSVALGTNQIGVRVADRSGIPPITRQTPDSFIGASNQIKEVFFSNWLDSTIPRRKQLIVRVDDLTDPEAKQVLQVLGAKSVDLTSPKALLVGRAAYARTAAQVDAIDAAISASTTMAMKPKPGSELK